jgi:hypothetical protein
MNASTSTAYVRFGASGTRFRRPPGGRVSRYGINLLLSSSATATSALDHHLKVVNLTHFSVNHHHSSPFITKIFNLRAPGQSIFKAI